MAAYLLKGSWGSAGSLVVLISLDFVSLWPSDNVPCTSSGKSNCRGRRIRFLLVSVTWAAQHQQSLPSISFSTRAKLHWLLGRFSWIRTTSPILTELCFLAKGPWSGWWWYSLRFSKYSLLHHVQSVVIIKWFIVLNSLWKFLHSGPWGLCRWRNE